MILYKLYDDYDSNEAEDLLYNAGFTFEIMEFGREGIFNPVCMADDVTEFPTLNAYGEIYTGLNQIVRFINQNPQCE